MHLLDAHQLAPGKVHIRGLDHLTTNDIRSFALENFATERPLRVEWIDDTSANIIYSTEEAATFALASFVQNPMAQHQLADPLELRMAKTPSAHRDVQLYVRQALITDIKAPNAHETSRFYLMNPDKDPSERRKQKGRWSQHENGPTRQRRQREPEPPAFNESMYDDDAGALAARITTASPKRRQLSSSSTEGNARPAFRGRRLGDLFAGKLDSGRLRDRSASPRVSQDGDGRLGFAEVDTIGRKTRRRSSPLPRLPAVRSNAGRGLLPGHGIQTTALRRPANGTELFPAKMPTNDHTARELFPRRRSSGESNHRRSNALDAADGGKDLFANRITPSILRPDSRNTIDRPSNGIDEHMAGVKPRREHSIRGTASTIYNPGFSIRGAAGGISQTKVLFPGKSSNVGKEVFGAPTSKTANTGKELFGAPTSKIANTGKELFGAPTKTIGVRKRAEDMFT